MTRRRLLWVGAGLLLAVPWLAWLLIPPDPVSQIKAGMWLNQVEAVFAPPYADEGWCYVTTKSNMAARTRWYVWSRGSQSVSVEFKETALHDWEPPGLVYLTTGAVNTTGHKSPLDRLRAWLGW